jgi:hypothetical protein
MQAGKGLEVIASIALAMLGIAMVAVVVQSPNSSKVITSTGNIFVSGVRAVMGK